MDGSAGAGFRPYSVGCTPDEFGELTYLRFIAYWGAGLPTVSAKLKEKLKITGFNMKPTASGKNRHEDHTAVIGMTPAVINYVAGQGKYTKEQRLVFYHELPVRSEPDTEWWPVQVLALRPDKQTEYAVGDSDDTPPEYGKLDKLIDDVKKSENLSVNDLTELLKQGLVVSTRDGTKCWVICGYQWLDDTPDAWPVRIRSRM